MVRGFGRLGGRGPMDELRLGDEKNRVGQVDKAMAAYRRAMDSGHPEAAPAAAIKLGIIRKYQGDLPGAIAAYRVGWASRHPEKAPTAAFLLGGVLNAVGDHRAAAEAYEFVIRSGGERAPGAMLSLGEMRQYDENRPDSAEALYERAADSGHPDVAPKAMCSLGALHAEQGDPDRARAWYQRAVDADHPQASPQARRSLRDLSGSGEEPEGESLAGSRPAEGVTDTLCLLLLDADGDTYGLWFEDVAIGDRVCGDTDELRKILYANRLHSLWKAGFQSGPSGDGGYRITFHPGR